MADMREPGLVRKGELHRIATSRDNGRLPLTAKRMYRSAAPWSMSKTTSMGSMVTMVASNVAVLASPPETRLPGLTRWRPMRPVMGARIWVNSRSSRTRCSAASPCVTWARAASSAWLREVDPEIRTGG